MKAILNDFEVRDMNYVTLCRAVNRSTPFPRELEEITQELINDPNLRFINAPTPLTAKLHRMGLGYKGDKSKVSYYWDILKGGGSLREADLGCKGHHQGMYFKITKDVKHIGDLLDRSLPFVEATFNLGAMKFQVEYNKHSLPNRTPYKTNVDFVSGNCYGDFTNSAGDTNLIPKMIELLMLAGNVADGLIVYNFVLGVGYYYDGKNPKLLKMCEDLYHKVMLLRDKQEGENKI